MLSKVRSLAPFFLLYVTFGATLGFLASGAPLILRARGVELAQIGLLQLINLPIGLTFLWALAVDRLHLPGLPHRLGWIAVMQAAAVALLVVLSFGEAWPLATLFALALAISVCVATMDVALEALVVESVADDLRPLVTAAKFCGASLGGLLGAGAVIGRYDALGWQASILCIAGLDALCLLPMLAYPESAVRRSAPPVAASARFERLRALAPRVGVLGAYFAALSALSSFNGLALVDLGLPLGEVGFVTGSLGAVVNLVAAPVAGALVRRVGTVRLVTAAAMGAAAAGCLMSAAAAAGSAPGALAATILGLICGGGLGVPVFTMIYRWARGPQPATDYAILFGASFFAAMPMRVAAPALAGWMGWPAYFALATLLYGAAFAVLRRAIARTEASDRVAGPP